MKTTTLFALLVLCAIACEKEQSAPPPAPTATATTTTTTTTASSSEPVSTAVASAPEAGVVCGSTTCAPGQTCCTGMPFRTPTCFNGQVCPISRGMFKKDIAYLDDVQLRTMHDDIVRYKLASYRYKNETEETAIHYGFLIDDVVGQGQGQGQGQSPSVTQSGERVDLYGYTTMAVAALQVQDKRIADLEARLADMEKKCRH